MGLDGFSMYPLAKQLHAALAGGRIDRIFQPNKHTVIIHIRQPRSTLTLCVSINPQNPALYLTTNTFDNPASPPLFCMVLRKHIEDGRVAAIEQYGLDRIININIDTLGANGIIITKTLTIELMGKHSNIILRQDLRIVDALRKVGHNENRVRQILPGYDYVLPPQQDKLNLLDSAAVEWQPRLLRQAAALPLHKALVQSFLGLGPISAKEIAWRAGLPGTLTASELTESDWRSLTGVIAELIDDYRQLTVTPSVAIDANNKLLAIAAFPLEHLSGANTVKPFVSVSDALSYSIKISGSYVPPDKERYKKIIANELAKSRHKLTVLQEELEQAHNADDYKIKADILMTYQYQIPDSYQRQIELPNIYSDDPAANLVVIELDPALSAVQNSQKYYQKYTKLKRAQISLAQQVEQCRADGEYLASIESSLENSHTAAELSDIKNELCAAGYIPIAVKRRPAAATSEPLQYAYDGIAIIVGKNNYQNDRITFKSSRPDDVWLHVKDSPGSHVLIRCHPNEAEQATLEYAAKLAAYYSKARTSSNVPVDYTKCRYVKKPSGAKPGFVIYTNQKTLYVTPDATPE